jgi:predicted dehydrogenase
MARLTAREVAMQKGADVRGGLDDSMTARASNDKLRVAVIGCGHWGPNHIRNFASHQHAQVVSCADLDPSRLQLVRDLFPSVETTDDVRQILDDPRVEAVVIATPTVTHFDLTKRALAAAKHVLCEKPLATNPAEASELVALAREARRVLMVGHVFLFNAGIVKLRELVASGELGRPYYLHATRTNLGPVRQDVDCVWDLATHDVSIFNCLLGSVPLEVSARGAHFLQDGRVDVAFITLTYPNNVLANIWVSWLDPKKVRQITVVGDRKMVTWDDMASGVPITIYDKEVSREPFYTTFGEFQLLTKEGNIQIPKVPAGEPLRAQTDHFIASVHAGRIELSGPSDGLRVVQVLEAISTSIAAKGAPVCLRS